MFILDYFILDSLNTCANFDFKSIICLLFYSFIIFCLPLILKTLYPSIYFKGIFYFDDIYKSLSTLFLF